MKVRTVILDDNTGRGLTVFCVVDCIGISNADVMKMLLERKINAKVSFEVDDVDFYAEKCRQKGFEIFMGPKEVVLGSRVNRVAFCHGPLGEDVEFFKPVK